MNYKELTGKSIKQGFEEFINENPHVYTEFENQVFNAIKRGRKKLSAKLIINWIRWNEYLRTSDENFKINDAFQSYFARHFICLNPDYAEIFNLRKLRNEEEKPYMTINKDKTVTFH